MNTISREEALKWVEEHIKKRNLIKHMLATGACMKYLAKKFNEDENLWELAGLLHDIDYEKTYDNPENHGFVSIEILKNKGLDNQIIFDAILAHCSKKPLEKNIEKAIYAVDPTTGFIVACALMHPTKSLDGLDLDFMMKRFKEKRFAAGASREQMKSIETLGLSLEEFLEICLEAMKSIKNELEL
ncbi:MAG: HD domain-containing protein [bacterium]|nr:HD domain-containing protein [bacterium]